METKPCTCGQTYVYFNPDRNVWESDCEICLYLYDPFDDYNPDGGNICVADWFPEEDELPF